MQVPGPALVLGEVTADEVAPTTTVEKQDMERREQKDGDWAWKELRQNLRLVRGGAVLEDQQVQGQHYHTIPNPAATGSVVM